MSATESFLSQKGLYDAGTLSKAMSVLSSEISPNQYPAAASTQYRKNLALNLFYKVGETVPLNNDAQVSCSFIL